MKRETGLRRTRLLTGALVVASVAGTVAVGVAAHASDSATSPTTSPTTGTGTSGTSDWPSLSGADGGGQATSGGS